MVNALHEPVAYCCQKTMMKLILHVMRLDANTHDHFLRDNKYEMPLN